MSRKCRKCNEIIPVKTKINGKIVSLQNRKFCLRCSPYKHGNTSPYDPFIRKPKRYRKYSDRDKEVIKLSLYFRALRIRRELYQKLGGKCKNCGYCKCDRALSFHHRNREDKLFGLSLNNLWSKRRDLIDTESEKCDLLCLNCHAELEDSLARQTSIVNRVNEKYGTNF